MTNVVKVIEFVVKESRQHWAKEGIASYFSLYFMSMVTWQFFYFLF